MSAYHIYILFSSDLHRYKELNILLPMDQQYSQLLMSIVTSILVLENVKQVFLGTYNIQHKKPGQLLDG